jgi:choline-sulfatase
MRIKSLLVLSLLFWGCSKAPEKKAKPNIVVILTDQERYPTHWPEGWIEKNLPSYDRLKKHGMTFTRAYTAASECTPSRAVLFSSEYYPINKVPRTPTPSGLPSASQLMDLGQLLTDQAGYDVVWKGKWHLTLPLDGYYKWTEKDVGNIQERYDLYGWTPPDAGDADVEYKKLSDGTIFNGLKTLGGGLANNDYRFLYGPSDQYPGWGEGALEYIEKAGKQDKPFCLFISLVNPHDVWIYPTCWEEAGYKREEFAGMGIALPSNYTDDLSTKPSVQKKVRDAYQKIAPLKDEAEQIEYVNFYAYLTKIVDQHVMKILDALDKAGLTENTIIIRTADHGELGLSHGMRQKSYTAYEEMIHIPFVVSSPKLFPTPQTSDAFYCHVDMLPTIAELAGVPDFTQYGKGVSIVPVLTNLNSSVQDSILFNYDDQFFLSTNVPASHIRAIREGDWMYAVYYSEDGGSYEYEMYNLREDPDQLHNLLFPKASMQIGDEAQRLHVKLKEKIDAAGALPAGVVWPPGPKGS